jgi:hypothetical protein
MIFTSLRGTTFPAIKTGIGKLEKHCIVLQMKKSFFIYSTLSDDDFLGNVEYVTMLKVGLKQLFYRFR